MLKQTIKKSIDELLAEALIKEENQLYKIPDNWVWVKLGAVGNFIAGSGFPKKFQGLKSLQFPFYKVGSLKNADDNYRLTISDNYVDDEIIKKIKAKIIPLNSIVFAKIGEAIRLNRRAILTRDSCIDNNMMAFKVEDSLLAFVFYWYLKEDFYQYARATTVPSIRKSTFEGLVFPLPPLTEQKRIVTKLSSMLGKLKQAMELIQEAKETFENRRAAILHKAFAGELTKKWREENNQESSSLSNCNNIMPIYKIPLSWKWVTGEKLFVEKPRNGFSPKATANPTSVKTLKLGATTRGYFNNTQFKYIDEKIPKDSRLWLKNGDLLIQRANSIDYVGITAIYNDIDYGFIYPDLMMKTQINEKYYIPSLFVYWANSALGTRSKINHPLV